MPGSIEYFVTMSIDPGTPLLPNQFLYIRLWGAPENWYTFRQVFQPPQPQP